MADKKFRCASFFAGAGGIDIGFEQTGKFDIVYANEIDKYPVKTYELNFPIKVDNRSITDVQSSDIPDFDVMLAGFPCTDISIAGKQQGLYNNDGSYTRSGLFFELIRIIHDRHPRVVFLENVKNLVSHNNGETFRVVLDALKKEGYNCKWHVMNAMDYGNTPQNRERIYIICFLDMFDYAAFEFPDAVPLTKSLHDVIDYKNKVSDKYYYTQGKYKQEIYDKLVKAMTDENVVYQYRRYYVRKNKQGVVPTLTANMGSGGHNVPLVKTSYGIRKLTPHECFNVQGFPSDFKLPTNIADSRLYKQAGNSVCVDVVRRLAENIVYTMIS